MRFVWTVVLCATLLGSGRTSAAGESASPTSGAGRLALHECRLEHPLRLSSVAARCGLLDVPENPAQPRGATLALHVAVIPALNRQASAAPLFLLAGGPGQAASDLYTSYAGAFSRINRNHDIVLVDQRGTGRSARLSCSYPDDWSAAADDPAAVQRATAACLAKYGDRVRYYTTSVAILDLERVRLALGYGAIDLYGSSYGTRVAELYMRRHPGAVHAVILDGVTYPQQAIGPDTPSDGERALNLIVARCEHSPECAGAFPELRRELELLRQRFGPQTLEITIDDPASGEPLHMQFNRSVLNAALRFLSYNAVESSLLPALLHQAAAGNPGLLASQTIMMGRQIGDQLAGGMQNSVICSEDEPLFATSAAERQRIAMTYQGADQLDALRTVCKIWPRGPVDADLHSALTSSIPTLLLSGGMDPVTPPADAELAARGLEHHRSLVLAGEGHGQLATGCVPRLMAEFLDDARPERLDVACLGRHRAAPFFVGLAGPPP